MFTFILCRFLSLPDPDSESDEDSDADDDQQRREAEDNLQRHNADAQERAKVAAGKVARNRLVDFLSQQGH